MNDTIEPPENQVSESFRANVIRVLEAVLADARFAAAPQMSAFLNYVVRKTLDGGSERIKAYTVGVDALGKPETFDPQNDPSVRVLAKRLRTFLDEYNVRNANERLYIELRPGSYRPLFLTRPDHPDTETRDSNDDSDLSLDPTNSSGSTGDGGATMRGTSADDVSVGQLRPAGHASASKPAGAQSTQTPFLSRTPTQVPVADQGSGQAHLPAQEPTFDTSSTTALDQSRKEPTSWYTNPLYLSLAAAGLIFGTVQLTGHRNAFSDAPEIASLIGAAAGESEQSPQALAAALPAMRPTRPQIEVRRFRADNRSIEAELATLLSSAMFGAEAVDVLRGGEGLQNFNAWPERYLLSLQRIPSAGDQARVEIQLVNASDQRLVHVTTLELDLTESGELDSVSLEAINTLALSLVQDNGPVISDHQRRYAPAE